MSRTKRLTRALALAAAVVIPVAGCGSSSSSSTSPTSSTNSSSSSSSSNGSDALLGTPKAATGTPIQIGYVTTGNTSGLDSTKEVASLPAFAKYINEYMGGIGGHPIKFLVCKDEQTPSLGKACENQMIAAKVPAVLSSSEALTDYATALPKAGIVYMTDVALVLPGAGAGAYSLANAQFADSGAAAVVAKQAGVTKAAYLVVDVPGYPDLLKALAVPTFKAAGVDVTIAKAPIATADLTPQIAAILRENPGLLYVVGSPAFCISAFSAANQAGYKGIKTTIPQCVNSTSNSGIKGGGLNGIKTFSETTTSSDDPDVKKIQAILAKYNVDAKVDDIDVALGYQVAMGFAQGLSALSGDLTFASINSTLKAAPEMPLPAGGGITYKCDGTKAPGVSYMCSNQSLLGTYDSSGVLGKPSLISPAG